MAAAPENGNGIQAWRAMLATRVLDAVLLVGGLLILPSITELVMLGAYVRLVVLLLAYLAVLLVRLAPRASTRLRISVLLLVLVVLGIYNLVLTAHTGHASLILLSVPALASLFLGRRAGFGALAVSVAILLVFAALFATGVLAAEAPPIASLWSWITRIPVYVLLALILMLPQEYLISRLTQALHDERRATEALEDQRAFLATVMELLPVPILVLSPDQTVLSANAAMRAAAPGVDLAHWWMQTRLLDPHTGAPLPMAQWPAVRALRGESVRGEEWTVEMPGGRRAPLLIYAEPVRLRGGPPAAVVALQDISALREADKAKNQFLMTLSHELRTPLTVVIGWAQLGHDAPEVAPEAFATILRTAREQQAELDRLIILARILTGKLALRRAPVDVGALLAAVGEESASVTGQRDVAFDVRTPAAPLRTSGDADLLRLALKELLGNALRETGAGGGVSATLDTTDGCARVVVTDGGSGIAPERLVALRRPFSQLRREETRGGLGVGLALATGIIEAHGGRLELASAGVGCGTTVTILLPMAGDADARPA